MRKILPLVLILMLIPSASAEVVSVPSQIYSKGVVGVPSSFKINLTVNPAKGHIPIDVVLAIDCSPSMERFSKVIYGPETVNITKKCGCCCGKWVAIANFTLDKDSDVEIILSYPHEDYYNESWRGCDRIDIWISNYTTMHHGWCGCCCGCKHCKWQDECGDPAVFLFENVPKGEHTIYAKLHGKPRTEMRVLVVALPPSKIDAAKEVAKEFVGMLSDYDRAGIVRIGSVNTTSIVLPLTNDKATINSTIDGLSLDSWICIDEKGGWHHGCHGNCGCNCGRIVRIFELTALGEGIAKSCEVLNASSRNSVKAIILLTDGDWNNGVSPIDMAKVAKALGYRIYTIGFGVVNESLLKEIAEITGGKYYYAPSCDDLKEIFDEIYHEIVTYAKNVTLKLEFVNPNVEYVKSVPSGKVTGNTVTWQWSELKNSTSVEVWVNSTKAGNLTVAVGNLTFEYYNFTTGSVTTAHQSFNVVMNFTGNFVVNATPDKNAIWEGETVNVTITANYPIASVSYSATPPITPSNSNVNITISGTKAVFSWTPFYNYINANTTATITFNVTSVYGLRNSTNVSVSVFNVKNIPPLTIHVKANRSEMKECETLEINVTASNKLANVDLTGTPAINSYNSIVHITVNGNHATIYWTPLSNYVDRDRYVALNVSVTDVYGQSDSSKIPVLVKNIPWILEAPKDINVTEGNIAVVNVRAINFIPDSVVIGNITPLSPNLTVEHIREACPTLNDSNLTKISDTEWVKSITPQYDFIINPNVTYVKFRIVWNAILNGSVVASNTTNVTVRNNASVNLSTDPYPKVLYAPPDNRTYYVGDRIPMIVKFVNATEGEIRANGILIWNHTEPNPTNFTNEIYFIPNAPGVYNLTAVAIKNGNATSTYIASIRVYIKPVTPS